MKNCGSVLLHNNIFSSRINIHKADVYSKSWSMCPVCIYWRGETESLLCNIVTLGAAVRLRRKKLILNTGNNSIHSLCSAWISTRIMDCSQEKYHLTIFLRDVPSQLTGGAARIIILQIRGDQSPTPTIKPWVSGNMSPPAGDGGANEIT